MESSAAFMTCALKVNTQTRGWQKSMIKVLSCIQGVSYNIDAQEGLAHLSGNVEPATLMKMLAKAGKHAELYWMESRPQNRNNPPIQGDVYGNDYSRLDNGYGHGYGYNQYPEGRLGYYGDDLHGSYPAEEHQYPHYDAVARSSPTALNVTSAAAANKQTPPKPVVDNKGRKSRLNAVSCACEMRVKTGLSLVFLFFFRD